jgi:hypothetical protein
MKQRYEYKFVKFGGLRGRCSLKDLLKAAKCVALDTYEQQTNDLAKEGWRLIRIIPASLWSSGPARYYELIFEREIVE